MANSRTGGAVQASAALLPGPWRTHPGEPQGGPGGAAGAAPEAVEGDLDDEFRPVLDGT
ncbi:hypothetical protein [Kitasatospora sp. NPDC101183]|uniref:hypothetical protein n=1 Tax=Kitasatospora sp. NPDC101183 TaxID=3364100 RepID=UPI0037F56992